MNIDDLRIGRSVHNLGRGEMRVFRTPWSACSRHAGIRQQTPCLLSCFVYWPTLQWGSNGLMCYPAACECSTSMCRIMWWIIPSLPFARPAYVHRFDVSLKMVFVLMLVFIGRPEPDRQTHFWLIEVSITILQPSSLNTMSPRRVICPLESDWSAHCCRTSSVKVMALSKIW